MRFRGRVISKFLFTESGLTKRNEPAAKTDSQGQNDLFESSSEIVYLWESNVKSHVFYYEDKNASPEIYG